MTRRLLALALPIALLTAACSSADNPASPSPLPAAGPSTTGATITGSVAGTPTGGGSSMTGATTSATGPAVSTTVSIVGTTITVTVDASGKFTLTNVPAGTLQLQINGPGFAGIITVENVKAGETIELSLSVIGAAITVASERRSEGSEEQLEGLVESLASPNLVVAGRTVTTDGDTKFFIGSTAATFADLVIGQRVHVKGQPDGVNLAAREVDIQNEKVETPVNVNGIVSLLLITLPDFQFEVDGRLVMGDALTEFFGNSVFADLVDGARVEVKGEQRDGFVYAKRIHVTRDDATETEFTGVVSGLGPTSGVCPTITFMVGTTVVTTTASTEFKNTTCPSVINGATVEVSGTIQPDGSVVARKISIEDDANETEFTGAITSLGPPLVVGSTTVQTTVATLVRRRGDELPLDILQVGMTVEVSGTTQSDGSVIAKKITIETGSFDVDVEGVMTIGSGSCQAITFTIGGTTYVTSDRTEFKKTICAALTTGTNVKVRGVLRPDGVTVEVTRIEAKN